MRWILLYVPICKEDAKGIIFHGLSEFLKLHGLLLECVATLITLIINLIGEHLINNLQK